jgi:hypothetical protein
MEPGEIYWIDLASGRRPGLVGSRESLNQGNDVVMVIFTTKRFAIRSKLPNCVPWRTGPTFIAHDRGWPVLGAISPKVQLSGLAAWRKRRRLESEGVAVG